VRRNHDETDSLHRDSSDDEIDRGPRDLDASALADE